MTALGLPEASNQRALWIYFSIKTGAFTTYFPFAYMHA